MSDIVFITDSADRKHWFRGIGAYRIATELRKQGYTVKVIDFIGFYNFDSWQKIIQKTVTSKTKYVGISCSWMAKPFLLSGRYANLNKGHGVDVANTKNVYYNSFSYAFTMDKEQPYIDVIKEIAPKAKFLLGGNSAVDFMEKSYFDHIFLGFSESMLLKFFEDEKNNIIIPRLINWDITGTATWNFTQNGYTEYTKDDLILPNETLPLEVGRGCIFKCKFCSFPLLGKQKGTYIKDPDVLYHELLTNYKKWGVTNYVISDETFNDDTNKLKELKKIIQKLPFQPNFWAFCRIELLEKFPEQAQLLLDIGLREVNYGLETLNDKTAKTIGKGLDSKRKKEILKFAKSIWKDRIRIKGNFIVGLPYETEESIQNTAEYILSDDCPIDFASFTAYILMKRDNLQNLRWNSVFDKEYEDWGYFFKDNESPLYWYKKDDTNIKSFVQATKLASYWQEKIAQRNKPTELFYYANDAWHNKSLNELLELDANTFYNMRHNANYGPDILFAQVEEKYVDRLCKISM